MGEARTKRESSGPVVIGSSQVGLAIRKETAKDLAQMSKAELQRALEQERELMEKEAQEAAKVDLLQIIRETPEKFPLQACGWNILMEMVEVPDKMGRFMKTKDQMRAEQLFVTCGRVLLAGPAALTGKTESNIPLDLVAEGISTPADLIGRYFHIQRYTGNEVLYAPQPTKQLKYITISEFLGVTTDPRYWVRDAL